MLFYNVKFLSSVKEKYNATIFIFNRLERGSAMLPFAVFWFVILLQVDPVCRNPRYHGGGQTSRSR